MKCVQMIVLVSLLSASMGVVLAQSGGGKGSDTGQSPMGAGPAASAPGMGMGPGSGRGVTRWGSNYTPGWALMTQQERNEHRERMRLMKTYEDCKAYREQHHEQMVARAKERGGKTLAQPRRDACAGLKQ